MKNIKYRVCGIFSMILYERGRERLMLILNIMLLIPLELLKLIKPLVGFQTRNKIENHCQLLLYYKINFFRHPVFILGFSRPTIRVCITYRCNAYCEFCYARGLLDEFPKDMSLDDFGYLVRWAKAKGWKRIMFLGGEPTIHPQFTEMLDICYNQGLSVGLSSNGFFDAKILQKLQLPFVDNIAINHPKEYFLPEERKRCLHNLEQLANRRKFFLQLSAEVDGKGEGWREVIELAARLNLRIRWILLLPGYARITSNQAIFDNLNLVGSQLLEIIKTCVEKNVICFVCRPVPACIFTPEQWQQIRKMGRYLAPTRCQLGYKGDYTLGLTINPDLSTYPCNAFFIKGPHISSFQDRASISKYYETVARGVMTVPPVIKCNDCQQFRTFLSIVNGKNSRFVMKNTKENFFDQNICQAGCINLRDHSKLISSCSIIHK